MSDIRYVGPGSGGVGSATISMSVNAQPLEGGSVAFSMPTFINSSSCIERRQVALASGENVISVPDAASWVFISPPATNSTALYVRKYNSTDTDGLQLGPTQGAAFSFPLATGRSFEIYTAGAINVIIAFF